MFYVCYFFLFFMYYCSLKITFAKSDKSETVHVMCISWSHFLLFSRNEELRNASFLLSTTV